MGKENNHDKLLWEKKASCRPVYKIQFYYTKGNYTYVRVRLERQKPKYIVAKSCGEKEKPQKFWFSIQIFFSGTESCISSIIKKQKNTTIPKIAEKRKKMQPTWQSSGGWRLPGAPLSRSHSSETRWLFQPSRRGRRQSDPFWESPSPLGPWPPPLFQACEDLVEDSGKRKWAKKEAGMLTNHRLGRVEAARTWGIWAECTRMIMKTQLPCHVIKDPGPCGRQPFLRSKKTNCVGEDDSDSSGVTQAGE